MVKKSKSTQQEKKLNDADQQNKVQKTIQKKTENSKNIQDEQILKCQQQNESKKPEMIQTTLEQFWKKGRNINIKQRQKYEAPPLIFEQGCITPNAEWWRINFCLETKTTN